MKKDLIFAIGGGLLLGTVVAISVLTLPSLVRKKSEGQNETTNTITLPTQKQQQEASLEITSPQDESIAVDKTLKVAGKTGPAHIILFDTDAGTDSVEASGDGSFSFATELVEGQNTILVTSYSNNGEKETKTLTVFYTGEKL